MVLTRHQQIKLRQISDEHLYNKAVRFIEDNGTISNSQVSGLENIADTATGFSYIIKFVNHQAEKDNENISKFYRILKREFENLKNDVKNNRDFIPENLTRKKLSDYTEFFGVLFAREFIRHLSAEHRYRSED